MSECVSLEALSRVLVDLASREREQRDRGEEGMRDWVRARSALLDVCDAFAAAGVGASRDGTLVAGEQVMGDVFCALDESSFSVERLVRRWS